MLKPKSPVVVAVGAGAPPPIGVPWMATKVVLSKLASKLIVVPPEQATEQTT